MVEYSKFLNRFKQLNRLQYPAGYIIFNIYDELIQTEILFSEFLIIFVCCVRIFCDAHILPGAELATVLMIWSEASRGYISVLQTDFLWEKIS